MSKEREATVDELAELPKDERSRLLVLACKENNSSKAYKLLNAGAVPEIMDIEAGKMPVHYAAQHGNLELVKKLITIYKVPLEDFDKFGNTPLHLAASFNHTDVIAFLIRYGAYENEINSNRQTPLIKACMAGSTKAGLALIQSNPKVNAYDRYECTAIYYAAQKNDIELVKALLAKGANPDVINKIGCTPIHMAAQNNNFELVKAFMEKGAKPHLTDENGYTPLYWAAKNNNIEIAKALIADGGYINAHAAGWKKHIRCAAEAGSYDFVVYLLKLMSCIGHEQHVNAQTEELIKKYSQELRSCAQDQSKTDIVFEEIVKQFKNEMSQYNIEEETVCDDADNSQEISNSQDYAYVSQVAVPEVLEWPENWNWRSDSPDLFPPEQIIPDVLGEAIESSC